MLTATAIVAAASGSVAHFESARHFASWFGLTPKESSSGGSRHLGRISKMGDTYLRMPLTHGARWVIRAATVAKLKGQELIGVRHWVPQLQARSNHNKAACALANKMARFCCAVLRDHTPFGQPATRFGKKMQRQSFELAHRSTVSHAALRRDDAPIIANTGRTMNQPASPLGPVPRRRIG